MLDNLLVPAKETICDVYTGQNSEEQKSYQKSPKSSHPATRCLPSGST